MELVTNVPLVKSFVHLNSEYYISSGSWLILSQT